MPLVLISSPPETQARAEREQATPASFAEMPPVRMQEVDPAVLLLQPPVAELGAERVVGKLWLTDRFVAFMPSGGGLGLKLDYPTIALHAASRSVPETLGSDVYRGACLYCQLDEHPEQEEDEREDGAEDEGEVKEMWIGVPDAETLNTLFETLSYCASLHPSGGADAADGNPFAGIAPFGSGAAGDDDDEDYEEDQGRGLSEHGRTEQHTLAHLDAVLDDRGVAGGDEHSLPPMATNTLLFTNLPGAFFDTSELLDSMLDLLRAHGTLVQFTPLPAFERASAVFKSAWEAWAVKRSLDRLVMVFEGDEHDDAPRHATEPSAVHSGRTILRVYFHYETPLLTLTNGEVQLAQPPDARMHLEPPGPERELLISPPGSPPVGWEQTMEERPNQETLAEDLVRALRKIASQGQDQEGGQAGGNNSDGAPSGDQARNTTGSPLLVVPPSHQATAPVPGVMVHASPEDAEPTAEGSGENVRPRPTARPPDVE